MELHQIRYFLAVVKAGSFVAAAEQEGVAQPSLSQQIKKLESSLGVPLFDRLGRSVKLTAYGQAFMPEAEAVLRQLRRARRAIDALLPEDCGSLTVGVIPTVLPYAIAAPLAAFRAANPAVTVTLRELTTDVLVNSLRNGEVDVAVLALPIRHPEVVCSELYREPLMVALASHHPLAAAPELELSRLQSEPMLLLREGHCLRQDVLSACSQARARFENLQESDNLVSIFAMVAHGFGISLVPERTAQHAAGCTLVPIKPRHFRRIGYAQAAGHAALPVQKHLIRFLRAWPWAN
ncbi:MAG: LysR family transcriptional regulator [Acidobacteria bacterium]|nr:LysR family transcriptional regulator [Acidobacteriota bacterium]